MRSRSSHNIGKEVAGPARSSRAPAASDHFASDVLREAARDWIARLAAGDITESQMQKLRSWLAADARHREAFAGEKANWKQMAPARARIADSLRLSPGELPSRRRTARPTRSRRKVAWASGGLLAASLAVALVVGNPLIWLRAHYATGVGEVATIKLPDGSIAVLNTDTAVAMRFENGERLLSILRGEAFFDVRPDEKHPFRVEAGSAVAEAVGTAFSVSRDGSRATVRVTEGIVALGQRAGDEAMHIRAGMQASLANANSKPEPAPFDEHVDLAWQDRRIVIENQPLESALAHLNRFRRGHILLLNRSHAASHVSGTLALDRLDRGLEALASTQGLEVTYLTPYLAIVH